MTQDSPSRRQDQFVIRLPDGMRERIAAAAKANGRSMNAEIVQLLEMYYPPAPPADQMADMIVSLLRMTNGNPPPDKWSALYSWMEEFHARLLRDRLTERYGEGAGAAFDRNLDNER